MRCDSACNAIHLAKYSEKSGLQSAVSDLRKTLCRLWAIYGGFTGIDAQSVAEIVNGTYRKSVFGSWRPTKSPRSLGLQARQDNDGSSHMSFTLFIDSAQLGPAPPYTGFCCHYRSRLSIFLSLSMRPILYLSPFWPLTAPLSTRGTASRIRQELSPPNYTVKHCHRPLMRTYYVSMDVLQPRSDQGTASQMVTSGVHSLQNIHKLPGCQGTDCGVRSAIERWKTTKNNTN